MSKKGEQHQKIHIGRGDFVETEQLEDSDEIAVSEPPLVPINGMDLEDNTYDDGYARWNTLKLIEHSKKFPVFDLPLAGIHLGGCAWGTEMTFDEFIHHCKRVQDTDLKHPILLDDYGQICDGYHRVCKAILEGRTTIKAIRLNTMPEPDMRHKKKEQ